MLAADFVTGVFILCHAPYVLFAYVFNDACRYNVATTILTSLLVSPGYAGAFHLILICVERYVAIVYPLQYETNFLSALAMKLASKSIPEMANFVSNWT